jgi:hypothetical protein
MAEGKRLDDIKITFADSNRQDFERIATAIVTFFVAAALSHDCFGSAAELLSSCSERAANLRIKPEKISL